MMTKGIIECISELVVYGLEHNLIEEDDRIYVTNRLLELFQIEEYSEDNNIKDDAENYEENNEEDTVENNHKINEILPRNLHEILGDMLTYAEETKLMEDNSITTKDLFDTKIMGCITPAPSVVRRAFWDHYRQAPKEATDYYYDFSKASNYIRQDRMKKDEKWVVESEYGQIDITINLAKPEKDSKDILRASKAKASSYPKCLLCKENEGFSGHVLHPARQNHRIIPLTLGEEKYYLQYSPYVYYNEHCIVFSDNHVPMKICRETFEKLLSFIDIFPHYSIGSNADLPIVGGSILSHDHFQGGNYSFAMEKAPFEYEFDLKHFPKVKAGVIRWPLSVIRLQCEERSAMVEAADYILKCWQQYSDEEAFIFSETDGEAHNTITPIARMHHGLYEMDLVLRNNITTEEKPWGIYHPIEKYHNIKKENIGLIEVMGLAILPARLKKEMNLLEQTILSGGDIWDEEELHKHAAWAEEWMSHYDITEQNIHSIIQQEIGKVFVKVLECAGVYKRDDKGRAAFWRFINSLNETSR